MYDDPA